MTGWNLHFPSNLDVDDVSAFVRSLTIRPNDRLLGPSFPLCFELTATAGPVSWTMRVADRHARLVIDQLRAHLPSVRTTEVNSSARSPLPRSGIELKLSHQRRPLRTDVAEEVARGLLGVCQSLRGNEQVTVQWLLGPPLPRRVAKADISTSARPFIQRVTEPARLDNEEAKKANDKQREPVFGALGRIVIHAATKARRKSLTTSVLGQLRLTSEPSAHLEPRLRPSWWVLDGYDKLLVPRIAWPCNLNAVEFATLLAWPVGGPVAAGVTYSGHRELPFASSSVVSSTAATKAREAGRPLRVIGEATYPGREGLVIQPVRDALQHTHLIGPTGVGKSTLLTRLAAADIQAGRGVVVIEPRGDVVRDILDRIPDHRRDDVVLLDPSDDVAPVGLQVLGGRDADVAVDALVHLMRSMFASSWGPRTQDVLHASLLTLARSPGMTMVELPRLLTDARFRATVIGTTRDDLAIGPFWHWFESLSEAERSQVVAPVLNKVRAFTLRPGVRQMIGQAEPRFSLRDVFTHRRVVLVPLQAGRIGPETAALLGGLVVAQLWQAAQERTAIPAERRHPVMVYLDEFQNYLHLPTDLGDVLAQARGLGLGLTLAHQHLGQLNRPEVRSAVLQNARSRVVFQSGSEDAAHLARLLGGGITPEDIGGLARYEAFARMMVDGTSTSPGSLTTLPFDPGLGSLADVVKRSRLNFGTPGSTIDEQIRARQLGTDDRQGGGRRPRRAS